MTEKTAQAIEIIGRLHDNASSVVLGKSTQIKLVLSALICRGHVLLEDVPGTAKTILARSLAASIEGAVSNRVQCTPDLQPTDVTGLSVWDPEQRRFEFQPGPIFTNVLLVDEINRALAEGTVGAARGHGRAAGHRRRGHPRAAAAVPAHRDGELDRAGGDVPAAGGAARPLPDPHLARLSDARRGALDRRRAAPRASARAPATGRRRSRSWPSSSTRSRRSTSTRS